MLRGPLHPHAPLLPCLVLHRPNEIPPVPLSPHLGINIQVYNTMLLAFLLFPASLLQAELERTVQVQQHLLRPRRLHGEEVRETV